MGVGVVVVAEGGGQLFRELNIHTRHMFIRLNRMKLDRRFKLKRLRTARHTTHRSEEVLFKSLGLKFTLSPRAKPSKTTL